MAVVKVKREREKRNIMNNKWRLRGEEIWLEDDLTWTERRANWRMRQILIKEEAEGRRCKMGQGRIWIEGKCWVWDEERETLRDARKEIGMKKVRA